MAFIDDGHGTEAPKHLHQRGFRRISQHDGLILEEVGKSLQIAILLPDLPDVLLGAVDPQGIIAEDAEGQYFLHCIRRKVLSIQQVFLGINADLPCKIPFETQAIGV